MTDAFEHLSGIVPRFYYDLIARVLPGAFLIVGLVWTRGQSAIVLTNSTTMQEIVLAILGLGASYVAGVLITPLGSLIFETDLLARRHSFLRKFSGAELWASIDEIDRKSPSAAAVLTKMAAEVTLCQNLFVAAIIVWLVGWRSVHWLVGTTFVLLTLLNVVFRGVVLYHRAQVALGHLKKR